ncbi:MAG: LPP20 family lipoprotein [Bacteroidota bacterium]
MRKSWKTLKTVTSIKKAFLILGCLFFSSDGTQVWAQLRKAPSWVRKVPINDDAFYGVGMVSMKDYSAYRAKARKIALREIVEKIFVSINSSSSLETTYRDDQVDYLLNETVSIASSNFLMGHKKVSEWIDKRKDNYYVLFRLDRSTYQENRKEYFDSFNAVISLIQKEAQMLFDRGEIGRSTTKLSQAIEKLDQEINRLVEPEYSIQLQKLKLESIYELERQIDQIAFNVEKEYNFNATHREPLVIENFLITKDSKVPLNGLDLSLKVLQGDVFRYSFDHENHEALSIYGLFPQKGVAVIQIMVEVMLEDDVKSALSPAVESTVKSGPIVINFTPYNLTFALNSSTSFEGEEDIFNFFRNITNDLGLVEVQENGMVDLKIDIKPVGNVKKQPGGHYLSDLTFEVSILDTKNERSIFRYSLPRASVKAKNRDATVFQSFSKATNLSDQFLQGFITALCTIHF